MNSRLDALQAAVLDVKLDHLGRLESRAPTQRRPLPRTAGECGDYASGASRTRPATSQSVRRFAARGGMSCAHTSPSPASELRFTILFRCICSRRSASYGYKAGDFPVSEQLAKEVLALPIFAELTEEEITYASRA